MVSTGGEWVGAGRRVRESCCTLVYQLVKWLVTRGCFNCFVTGQGVYKGLNFYLSLILHHHDDQLGRMLSNPMVLNTMIAGTPLEQNPDIQGELTFSIVSLADKHSVI